MQHAAVAESSESVKRRLHVSGLNVSQCGQEEIKERFRSFGLSVEEDVFNWPPKRDAVGNVTDWCFVNVCGTASQVQRVMTLLNGTMWKGSKLRIGYAKQQTWKQGVEGVDSEGKKRKKRRGRGVEGFEDKTIDRPITSDSAETVWGWKKTPAGHLIRPMHMRPSHPIARPILQTADEKTLPARRSKKDQRTTRPLVRAKRVTIDPTRYNSAHLSGSMLEGTDLEFEGQGYQWTCLEDEDGLTSHWTLHDAQGNVIRQEVAPLNSRHQRRIGEASGSSSLASDTEEPDDVASSFAFDDEINAAIDRAIDEETDLSVTDQEESSNVNVSSPVKASVLPMHSEEPFSIVHPPYDPDEDDAFSEGYQEVMQTDNHSSASVLNWTGEKTDQIALLQRMFGSEGLNGDAKTIAPLSSSTKDGYDEDDASAEGTDSGQKVEGMDTKMDLYTEDETNASNEHTQQTGVARRAELINVVRPHTSKPGLFQTITRFDPGAADEDEEDYLVETESAEKRPDEANNAVEEEHKSSPELNSAILKVPSASQPRDADRVEMQTLTDMFRPKEVKGGFSLLADFDLDLDDELNFEPDVDDEDDDVGGGRQDVAEDYWHTNRTSYTQQERLRTNTASSANVPLLFPRIDSAQSTLRDDGKDVISLLLQEMRQNETMARFYTKDDEETLKRKWDERKATLTQEFKRRHREALKKKKRKYTGARAAASTSFPGRRKIVEGAIEP